MPEFNEGAFQASEIAFIAESYPIGVIPRRRLEAVTMIGAKLVEMRPPRRTQVPLWLAILLRRQKRVVLVPPDWLLSENLTISLRFEEERPKEFSQLPYHWLETAELILSTAEEDVPEVDTVRRLLRDIREIRQSKAREGLSILDDTYLQMDHLGAMEINEIRPLFTSFAKGLRVFNDVIRQKADSDEDSDDENMNT